MREKEERPRMFQTLCDLEPVSGRRFSVRQIAGTITRIKDAVEGELPPVPCGEGCSDCCHDEVRVSKAERHLIEQAVGQFSQSLQDEVLRNALEREGICPVLIQERFGCALHDTGAKPLICQIVGVSTWNFSDSGQERTTVGCDRLYEHWRALDQEIRDINEGEYMLLPVGCGTCSIILEQTFKDPGGTVREIVLSAIPHQE